MKRIFICAMVLALSSYYVSLQAGKKKDTANVGEIQMAANDHQQEQDSTSSSKKSSAKKKKPEPKKAKSTSTTFEMKQPAQKAGKPKPGSKKTNEPAAPAMDVVYYYNQLPIDILPQLKDYMVTKNKEDKYAKLHDDEDYRKTFIRSKNTDAGYLQLNRPGEDKKYTRLQMFTAKSGQVYMAIEQSECTPMCTSTFHLYKKSGPNWEDVTSSEFPSMSTKEATSTIKARYKHEFGGYDEYNNKNFDNEANLQKDLMYTIMPEEGKIVLKEQSLNTNLAQYTFVADKGKFVAKKLDK